MFTYPQREITELLDRISEGDTAAYDQLMEIMYDAVRAIARKRLRDEPPGLTFQATDIVHDVYLRLDDWKQLGRGRTELFSLLARTIQRILVEHARKRAAARRRVDRLTLQLQRTRVEPNAWDLLALDEALNKLRRVNDRQSRIVQLRFFLGLTMLDIAQNIGLGLRTVEKEWRAARLWLLHEMDRARP